MAAQKTGSIFKPFVVICGSHHISSSRAHSTQNSNSYIHVFEVQLRVVSSVIFVNENKNENVEKRENNEFVNENENEKMMKTKTKLKRKK